MTDFKLNKCAFCNIIQNNENILFRNDKLVIIKDIRPASDHHYLAIPLMHIQDSTKLTANDRPLLNEMETELKNYILGQGISPEDASFGFHWPPFITVKHLHMHCIAPASKMSFMSRWIYKPFNIWYCTPQYVSSNLNCECKLAK